MDWTGCDLVETDPEKVGGKPVVKGTRVPSEVVLIDEEHGRTPEETHRSFPTVSVAKIRALLTFAHSRQSPVAALKVLLDENIPHDLRLFLRHHETFTAAYLRWAD